MNKNVEADDMAQPDDLSPVPRAHMVEAKNQVLWVFSNLYMYTVAQVFVYN